MDRDISLTTPVVDTAKPVIDQIVAPTSAVAGSSVTVTWRVSDDVGLRSPSPLTNINLFSDGRLVALYTANATLISGDSKVGSYSSFIPIPAGVSGTYQIRVFAYDGVGNLTEVDRDISLTVG